MNKNIVKSLDKIEIPDTLQGKDLPLSVYEQQIHEAKEKDNQRKQRKHDFRVALFSVIAGGISGFITSAILLHMQGLL